MTANEKKFGWISNSMGAILVGKLNKGAGAANEDCNDEGVFSH